jgi:hypothetical protein
MSGFSTLRLILSKDLELQEGAFNPDEPFTAHLLPA